MNSSFVKLHKVSKSFEKQEGQDLLVLDHIDLELNQGEIVALLGKSGSGKSTLLRIVAGLIRASSGEVIYRGNVVHAPILGISMVFQSFALMPWLTVLQNVELGLEAQGIPREERRQRALKAIDMIGLDGFESAYPKELSGGMRQRVGFARALVVNPDILLMDEAFSALDVLTAENLRSDLLDLWKAKQTPMKAILMVTHNITEAAMMADRIIVLNSEPATIRAELDVEFPHPRHEDDPKVRELIDEIYTLMTSPERDLRRVAFGPYQHKTIELGYPLPDVEVSTLTGLIEELAFSNHEGAFHLQDLSESLYLDVEELFPIIEMLDILHFAKIIDGEIELTKAGSDFAEADILTKKEAFASHLLRFIPLAKYMRDEIDDTAGHRINEEQILDALEPYLGIEKAKHVFTTVIDWGRYAELFAYDVHTRTLSFENPD